jgi:Raf kinase inhibitor-like YbhB/YbcL family protein
VAVSLTDLDAPSFVHWVIAGIPPTMFALDEDTVPLEAYEAANSLGDVGYTGPCPPAGSTHRYTFTVHYLGEATGLDDGTPAASLISAISASETATAEVTGTFSRS